MIFERKYTPCPHVYIGVSKQTLKRKMNGGLGWNLNRFGVWSQPIWVLSDVPVSRKWYKTVSTLYQNLYIWDVVKKSNVFNRSYSEKHNKSENYDNPEEPKKLRNPPFIIWIHYLFIFNRFKWYYNW